MRSVNRGEEPAILKQNSEKWTEDLLKARKKRDSKAIEKAEKKYGNDEIRKALEDMYDGFCCYCESPVDIGITSYGYIEHRKPKSKFPKDAFNWNNLHFACLISLLSQRFELSVL